jgi:hypothetical protein
MDVRRFGAAPDENLWNFPPGDCSKAPIAGSFR